MAQSVKLKEKQDMEMDTYKSYNWHTWGNIIRITTVFMKSYDIVLCGI
jgi:hypothetical protein